MYDMIIIGAGPAGLSAAIYMARAKYKVLVLEQETIGGQITITEEITNYPGVIKTSGKNLTDDMKKQALSFGVEFKIEQAINITTEEIKTVTTKTNTYETLSILLAVGARPRKAGFKNEEKFSGRGVAYCATCDGEFFQDMTVYVVGGGFAAVEEAMFLTKYASEVNILVRSKEFSCAKTITDKLKDNEKIKVFFNTEVLEILGEKTLNKIIIKTDNEINEIDHKNGFGIFVFAGYEPNTKWLENKITTDNGYIVTNNQQTNVNGIYAAGDVCIKKLRQVVTAVSDGAIAATEAEKYVENLHKTLNLKPFETTKQEISENKTEDKFIDQNIIKQLEPVFNKFNTNVTLTAFSDQTPLAKEMEELVNDLKNINKNLTCLIKDSNNAYLEIKNQINTMNFHTMPGGHEFNSFIIALYNFAGPGKEISEQEINSINELKQINIKVLISLSCTMCPEVVMSISKIASLNKNIQADIIDITKNKQLKEKHQVMSVPCIIINDEIVHFGKKSQTEIIEILKTVS